jgi:hypothetical protein
MSEFEKESIRMIKEKIQWCLKRNIAIGRVLFWLDDIIYNSPNDYSDDYFSELFEMQDMLITMKDK